MNGSSSPFLHLAFVSVLCGMPVCLQAGVEQSGLGPKAVQSFGLERPEARPELEPGVINTKNPFGGISLPADLLRAGKNGRVQLFSVSQLTDDDMRNPFEIRVQVAVDMMETVFEIGGIVEGESPEKNTVILVITPPRTGKPQPQEDEAPAEPDKAPAGKKNEAKKSSIVCSVGDVVQGFRIHAIHRDGIIVEQTGKFVEVPRGAPVIVCVPLSGR